MEEVGFYVFSVGSCLFLGVTGYRLGGGRSNRACKIRPAVLVGYAWFPLTLTLPKGEGGVRGKQRSKHQ